jgi:hypothetical protein
MTSEDTKALSALLANYLYTDMGISPESATAEDVEEAMRDLYFSGYSVARFRDHKNGGIKMNLFQLRRNRAPLTRRMKE